MLTVPEAARRTGRHPETIRRWIWSGRLRAQKVRGRHRIAEAELERVEAEQAPGPGFERWLEGVYELHDQTAFARRMPSGAELIRAERESH